jgi:acetate kinase
MAGPRGAKPSAAARTGEPRVLVLNCGSSSIKYQLLAMGDERRLAAGVVERIGEAGPLLRHGRGDERPEEREVPARDHREAFRHVADALRDDALGARPELAAIGHRVVHGGERLHAPILLDAAACSALRELSPLAPLHNPANLVGIEICLEAFPDVPQVAVFDTAFHQTLPPRAFRYAVPEEWYRRFGVRRYGFHGVSHRYVAERAASALRRPLAQLNLITLHLGNGASAAAIEAGRCIDTSMGLTPLEGLVMGSRSGDLDPAVPLHLERVAGLSAEEVDRALNQESGLRGLCGTNDVREILAREGAGDEQARLALEIYAYRLRKYLGAYAAVLGRLDAVVFTGGVGENAPRVRELACSGLERIGVGLDAGRNRSASGELCEIGRADLATRVLVVRTDEELQIARETIATAGVRVG